MDWMAENGSGPPHPTPERAVLSSCRTYPPVEMRSNNNRWGALRQIRKLRRSGTVKLTESQLGRNDLVG